MSLITLQPALQEKIWGGRKLADLFGMNIPSEQTGEAWCISGHVNGVSKIIYPVQYQGMGLDQLYQTHPELFGHPSDPQFPLLVKLLDAKEDLSVQVHPDNHYAATHEGELGKTECWYILDASDDAQIIYGHHAKDKEEFLSWVNDEAWDRLLRRIPVKKGDFFYVPHGTIHAIGSGIVILEIQQSSDTTYRVFDYHRKDAEGNERELHLKESLDVSLIPHCDPISQIRSEKTVHFDKTHYVTNEYFSVVGYQGQNMNLSQELGQAYYVCMVIDGEGFIISEGETLSVKSGDAFFLPYGDKDIQFQGTLHLMTAHVPVKEV